MTDWGEEAAAHLQNLAKFSAGAEGVTRLPYGTEHCAALGYLSKMMERAGMTPTLDAAATLVGRIGAGDRTFYMGSHQDSVPAGGAFDGIAGVVLAVLAMEKLGRDGVRLPFAVEVLAFADEEGVRFPTALVGSRAIAGVVDPGVMEMRDRDGVSMGAAIRGFGGNPGGLAALARDPARALGYLEAHIEQGPVLERAGEALGIVTGICGIERHEVRLGGEAGHAGTLPMEGRRDALVGASAVVLEVNRLARETPGLRGTVGTMELHPGAVNAVPGEARFTVELRAEDDAAREAAGGHIQDFARREAERLGLSVTITRTYSQPAAPCDPALRKALVAAVRAGGGAGLELTSGATHDASAMANLCPISMLFVRCRGGVSHRPDEFAAPPDLGAAIEAMAAMLRGLADA